MHHRLAALGQEPQAPRNFLICLNFATQITPEAIFVELLVGRHVPEPRAIGTDLVSQNDPAEVILIQTPELELEIDEPNPDAREQA